MSLKELVLLVDDDPMILQLLKQLFKMDGYSVALAKNGLEAVDKAKEIKPDIIVMDYMMPELNGLAACRQLNDTPETADIPVVIFSANVHPDLPEQSRQAGAKMYLDKSINIPVGLTEAVSAILMTKPSSSCQPS